MQQSPIGGNVTGLSASGLVLRNNGGNDLTVPSGATSFQFTESVSYGGGYAVTVAQQPTGLTCTPSNNSGNNVMNNVITISITCVTAGPPLTVPHIFVTSGRHNGNFGGSGGADTFCNNDANKPTNGAFTYKALLQGNNATVINTKYGSVAKKQFLLWCALNLR